MDQRERNTDHEEAIRAALDDLKATFWVAMPCEVVSVNLVEGSQTLVCQPQVQVKVRNLDGTMTWTSLPLLTDVLIVFPQGGPFVVTFPIVAGDEVLVVISDRCVDSWATQQSQNGPTIPAEIRFHDLSDGFAIPGIRSQARPLGTSPSSTDVQIRSVDGTTLIGISPAGLITLKAPGGVVIDGDLQVNGATIGTGEGTFNSIPVSTHLHGGVTGGGSNTGVPIP